MVDFSSFDLLIEDSVLFRLFFFYSTLLVAIFFLGSSTRFILSKRTPREFPLLVLFVHLGGLFLLRFSTFIDLLLALEIVTLASYVLVSFERQNRFSTYAGIQYFLVGSVPSARLLLGFSFFYLSGGSLVLQDLDLLFSSYDNTLITSNENFISSKVFDLFVSSDGTNFKIDEVPNSFASIPAFFFSKFKEGFSRINLRLNKKSKQALIYRQFSLFHVYVVARASAGVYGLVSLFFAKKDVNDSAAAAIPGTERDDIMIKEYTEAIKEVSQLENPTPTDSAHKARLQFYLDSAREWVEDAKAVAKAAAENATSERVDKGR